MNDVLLRVFRGLGAFAGTEPCFRSWVFTIAHARVVDGRRARARGPRVVSDPEVPDAADGDGSAEDGAMGRLGDERVARLLELLSPDQRSVLLLRVVVDLSVAQVAEILRKRPGAIKALQRRGLAALRREIERAGVPR